MGDNGMLELEFTVLSGVYEKVNDLDDKDDVLVDGIWGKSKREEKAKKVGGLLRYYIFQFTTLLKNVLNYLGFFLFLLPSFTVLFSFSFSFL